MIAAGLPYGELTEIKRNAGTIVRACHQIRYGKTVFDVDQKVELEPQCPNCGGNGEANFGDTPPWGESAPTKCEACDGTGKLPPKNLVLIGASKSQAAATIERQVVALRDAGVDAVWDVQVVVAVNKRSQMARSALNKQLQDVLNPGGLSVAGSPFRVNDKIICLKNSFFRLSGMEGIEAADEKGQVAVSNGEFGKVLAVEQTKTKVRFFNPDRVVEVSRAKFTPKDSKGEEGGSESDDNAGTGCDLDLAYAVTCHKLQGSDCDHVIVALDEYPGATSRYGICKREWLYTAISRAKLACYLVGQRSTAKTQCEFTAIDKRKTFLRELIEQYRAEYKARAEVVAGDSIAGEPSTDLVEALNS
jgi:hypothetical protein